MTFQVKDSITVNETLAINASGQVVTALAVNSASTSTISNSSGGSVLTISGTGRPASGTQTWTFWSNTNIGGPNSYIQFPDSTIQTTAWSGSVTSLVNGSYTATLNSSGQLVLPTTTTGSYTGGTIAATGPVIMNANGNLWAFDSSGNMTSPYNVKVTPTGFQIPGSTSGTISLAVPAVAGTNTVTFPATTGTVITTGDTGTVTNTMLAGSITNAKLVNSSVTVNGTSISLGGSATVTASAGTLTGTTLNSTVVSSSLTSVGALTGLTVNASGVFTNGDANPNFSKSQLTFGYNGTSQYPHWVHTTHNANSATSNAIHFYTSDGTAAGVFPTNGVLGLTITNGTIAVPGASTLGGAVSITNNTSSTSSTTGALVVTGGAGIGGDVFVGGAITSGSDITTGGSILSNATTAGVFPIGVITLNMGGGATSVSIGATSGTTTINHMLKVNYTGSTESSLQITGNNTKGGTGYHDFLKVTNTGKTNPNKYFRLDSNGTMQILNSAYNASVLNISDSGVVTIPGTATTASNTASTNVLNIATHGQLFDDGNFHVHSTSGALWINAIDGSTVRINTQSNSATGGVVMGGPVNAQTSYITRTSYNAAVGTEVTAGNMRFRFTDTTNYNPQVISNTGGSLNVGWTSYAIVFGNGMESNNTNTGVSIPNNSWTTLYSHWGLTHALDMVVVTIMDKNNSQVFRVTFLRGDNGATAGGNIIVEQLY